jgi:predicted metal-dependent hydrolase
MKSSTTYQMTVDTVSVEITKRSVKSLRIEVIPPDGRVLVISPIGLNNEAIYSIISKNLNKIKEFQTAFAQQQRETEKEYVSGESHNFAGRRYRLNVIYHAGKGKAEVANNRYINLYVKEGSTKSQKEKVMMELYRQHLKKVIPALIEKWQPVIGVKVEDWHITIMKRCWGNCRTDIGRLGFNLKLAEKSSRCLEYVVVHEMTHLLERYHNKRFHSFMSKFLPDWEKRKEELNTII